MDPSVNPLAPENLPRFVTAPGDTDIGMVIMGIILVTALMGFGVLFLRIHTLPERIAHKGNKLQFEIVAVLGLISLFTNMHIFWIIGLLLAMIDIPDFGGASKRMAAALDRIAGLPPASGSGPTGDLPTGIETASGSGTSAPATSSTMQPRAGDA